ncbi:hypothetical protein [Flavobacterium sp.]|uniref:hypothetical protein n=1 Tax=Flavobacterium sp. TaxID=239 RepID=UPI0035B04AB7
MKNLKIKYRFLSFLLLSVFFVSCEKDVTSENSLKNYIGMEPSKSLSIYPDETVSVESKVYASNTSDVDRTFNLVVDPASTHNSSYYSVPATVTIPAGEKVGTFQVSITGTDLGSGKNLIVGLEQIEGVDYAITSFTTDANGLASVVTSNKIKYTIEERCDFNKVVLSITFDNYPEETAWELYDADNNVVASGGLSEDGTTITGYAALGYADKSTFTTNFCLQSGTYTFVIYDDYGDGMYTSASVQGTYSLKLGSTVLASGGGNFGSFQDTTFTLP